MSSRMTEDFIRPTMSESTEGNFCQYITTTYAEYLECLEYSSDKAYFEKHLNTPDYEILEGEYGARNIEISKGVGEPLPPQEEIV